MQKVVFIIFFFLKTSFNIKYAFKRVALFDLDNNNFLFKILILYQLLLKANKKSI